MTTIDWSQRLVRTYVTLKGLVKPPVKDIVTPKKSEQQVYKLPPQLRCG